MPFFEQRYPQEVFSGDRNHQVLVDANLKRAARYGLRRGDLQVLALLAVGEFDEVKISSDLKVRLSVVRRRIGALTSALDESDPRQIAEAGKRERLIILRQLEI